jgi:hypothetical protein
MKYKICKFQDGNGKEWYQVKGKGWFFWKWIKVSKLNYYPYVFIYYEKLTFDFFLDAQKWVQAKQIKEVECVEV